MKKRLAFCIITILILFITMNAGAWVPEAYIGSKDALPDEIQSELDPADSYHTGILNGSTIYILMEKPDDARYILIYMQNEDKQYQLDIRSALLASKKHSPISIGSSGEDYLYFFWGSEAWLGTFVRQYDGRWLLRYVQTSHDFGIDAHLGVYSYDNDGGKHYMVGDLEYDLENLVVDDLPESVEEAFSATNTDGFALTKADSERTWVPLLSEASNNASTVALYDVGTPLKVIRIVDRWAEVAIETAHGFMPLDRLAFGEEMKEVVAGPIAISIDYEALDDGIDICEQPDDSSPIIRTLTNENYRDGEERIVGKYGDQWYQVMLKDGASGFIQRQYFQE